MEGIFGRDLELTAMEQFLSSTPNWPRAVVIEGEAGIGKTTLWLEAVRRAEERGMRALQARPAESEQKLSYVALADLVVEAFDEVRSALPQVQQRALAGALHAGRNRRRNLRADDGDRFCRRARSVCREKRGAARRR